MLIGKHLVTVLQGKTVKDLTRHFMYFYSKILLLVQFLEVQNKQSVYNLQSKTVNLYSQNSLRDTPHLKEFCLNNHIFFL